MRMTTTVPGVRPPAVAGAFYPAGRAELDRLVDRCLVEAARIERPGRGPAPPAASLVGLLVPHAGLVYSGAVAAAA